MFESITNLFKPSESKVVSEPEIDYELASVVMSLIKEKNVDDILSSSSSRIYILNTYTSTINDLMSNILSNEDTMSFRTINAVNVEHYFNKNEDVKNLLRRVCDILRKGKVSSKVRSDILEIVTSIRFLSGERDN